MRVPPMGWLALASLVSCSAGVGGSDPGTDDPEGAPGAADDVRDEAEREADADAEADAEGDPESCDGLDDDGDGEVDEDCGCVPGERQECYPADPRTRDQGPCRAGLQSCAGAGEFGEWSACEGAVLPEREVCWDDLDNDCSGEVDEGCGCDDPCTAPPAPNCADACVLLSYPASGTCDRGQCSYASERTTCLLGCDTEVGACREAQGPLEGCAGQACGTENGCGGSCEPGSGCCTETTYQRSSGFTYNGYTLCCDEGDTAASVTDCGDGDNHWVAASGDACGVAYEGEGNYGGPCVSITCHGSECL